MDRNTKINQLVARKLNTDGRGKDSRVGSTRAGCVPCFGAAERKVPTVRKS